MADVAQYIVNQPKENLLRYARENRALAREITLDFQAQHGVTRKEDLLRWADELEEIARQK